MPFVSISGTFEGKVLRELRLPKDVLGLPVAMRQLWSRVDPYDVHRRAAPSGSQMDMRFVRHPDELCIYLDLSFVFCEMSGLPARLN